MNTLFKKIKKIQANKKGFTLLETLVAIFILTLALTGPIYIATLAIRSSVESRDSISAYFLAEEAIEVVRNVRDTNAIIGAHWLSGLGDCHVPEWWAGDKELCNVQIAGDGTYGFYPCVGSCPAMTFDPNSNFVYNNSVSTASTIDSKFTREIYLQDKEEDKEVELHVAIKWVEKGRDREFKIIERLHNQEYGKYYDN
ncbi:MAG: prepilin-type N-terminal cleavage/methylation domain-containing protein [Patescibacteria group bacterium]